MPQILLSSSPFMRQPDDTSLARRVRWERSDDLVRGIIPNMPPSRLELNHNFTQNITESMMWSCLVVEFFFRFFRVVSKSFHHVRWLSPTYFGWLNTLTFFLLKSRSAQFSPAGRPLHPRTHNFQQRHHRAGPGSVAKVTRLSGGWTVALASDQSPPI